MELPKNCPTCGSPLTAETDGLCVKCLGRFGFAPESGGLSEVGLLRLGDYELIEEIARGGMGVVYRARQLSLNRIVAIKVLLHGPFADADFLRRFRNEAQAVAALRHPNIVAIHEIGEHNGNHFISLEYVEGQNFAELVRGHPLSARRAAGYLQVVAGAIEHAHQHGVLHRDLKPSNLLLDVFDQPRVTDFGLAKMAGGDADLTATGQVLGSPNYMSPEQAMGRFSDCTVRSDVYSLGAILYELLTGAPPFQGESLPAVLARVQSADPLPPRRLNPGIPEDLQTICLKCLHKDPARRYLTAQALADDLGRFLGNKPILARPVLPVERVWLWCRRHPVPALLSAGLAISVFGGVLGILWEWQRAERHARGELQQRLIAQSDTAKTRLNLYAADMALASQAMQDENFGQARRTLQSLRPTAGEPDLRGFEWRYLWQLCQGDQTATLTGHTRTVTGVAFSPDGTYLATASQDGTARVWNAARRELVTTLSLSNIAAWSVQFTSDGNELMTSSVDGVVFWNIHSWRRQREFPGEICALAQKSDIMATTESNPFYWESDGPVRLFNWRTGQLLGTLPVSGRALALSPDGRRLAMAEGRGNISLWDTATQTRLFDWPVTAPVWSLKFSPDGGRLVSSSWSSDVSLWPVDGRSPVRTFSGGQLHVWAAIFSPDGADIITTSSDQTVRRWAADSLALKSVWHGHGSEIWCAAFTADGAWLATGGKDKNVLLWSTTVQPRSPTVLPHDGDFRPVFSRDGKWLATVDPDSEEAELWQLAPPARQCTLPSRLVVGFAPDTGAAVSFNADALALECWRPEDGHSEKRIALAGSISEPRGFVDYGMSVDQKCFFAIDPRGLIRVWDVASGRLRANIQGPLPAIRNAVLSPEGRQLAVCVERENTVHLYDCDNGRGRELAGHIDFVSGLAFSPDGGLLATGSMDGSIRLWHTADGQTVAILAGHMQETTDVAFSPDGQTLASVGQGESLKFWHVPTWREVVSETVTNAGNWLQFSPGGRRLAVALNDHRVRILEAPVEH